MNTCANAIQKMAISVNTSIELVGELPIFLETISTFHDKFVLIVTSKSLIRFHAKMALFLRSTNKLL